MTHSGGPIVIVGIGNVLLRDDGVGVHVVRAIEGLVESGAVELPPGTTLLDGGTLGLGLLPWIAAARAVLLVDAIDAGRAPGAVEIARGDALFEGLWSQDGAHRGVGGLLAAAWLVGASPGAFALVGIQPGEVAVGLELTHAVRAGLPAAVSTVLDELGRLDAILPRAADGSVARGHDVGHEVQGTAA